MKTKSPTNEEIVRKHFPNAELQTGLMGWQVVDCVAHVILANMCGTAEKAWELAVRRCAELGLQ